VSRSTAEAFGSFASLIAKHFDGRVSNYITINEPQCFLSQGYECGRFAPGLSLSKEEVYKCMHNVLLAHGLAVKALREGSSVPLKIGIVSTGRFCYPLENTDKAISAAKETMFTYPDDDYSWMFTHHWLFDATVFGHYPENSPEGLLKSAAGIPSSDWDIIAQPTDYLGVNIYHGNPTDADGNVVPFPPGFPRTAMKWAITPEVMYYGPKFLFERYNKPMIIAENGLSCNDRIYLDGKVHDLERIDFLKRYLSEMKRASIEGVPILGYMAWSLLDNFEWAEGYNERFGIVYVDYLTGKRIPKDSFLWYAGIIREHGESLY
jgi:beta-glucosidase